MWTWRTASVFMWKNDSAIWVFFSQIYTCWCNNFSNSIALIGKRSGEYYLSNRAITYRCALAIVKVQPYASGVQLRISLTSILRPPSACDIRGAAWCFRIARSSRSLPSLRLLPLWWLSKLFDRELSIWAGVTGYCVMSAGSSHVRCFFLCGQMSLPWFLLCKKQRSMWMYLWSTSNIHSGSAD